MDIREQIIEVAGEIRELRRRLRERESTLDKLIGANKSQMGATGTKRSNSYGHKALEILNAKPAKIFNEQELIEALAIEKDKVPSFRSALSRLVKHGKLAKPKQQHYQSALFVPNADTEGETASVN